MQIKTKVSKYTVKVHQISSYRGRIFNRSLSLPKKDKTKKSFTTVEEGGDLSFRSSLPRMFFMQYQARGKQLILN